MKKNFLSYIFILFHISFLFSKISDTDIQKNIYYGELANKYPISVTLYHYNVKGKTFLFGYYSYLKNKTPAPIFLKGEYIDKENFYLKEYLDNGKENALFKCRVNKGDAKYTISGNWIGQKEYPFYLDRLPPIQDPNIYEGKMDNLEKDISKGLFSKNWQNCDGTVKIKYDEKNTFYSITLDAYTKNEPIHFGNLEDKKLQMHISGIHYYEANSKAKDLNDNCILFFLGFKDRVFIFEYGYPANIDFGEGVSAEGVYIIKK
jgi:hypothetical protein